MNKDNKQTQDFQIEFIPNPYDSDMRILFKNWIDLIEKPPEPIKLTLGEFFENVANVYGYDESYVLAMHEKYAPYLNYEISPTFPSFEPVSEDIIETEVTFTINEWVGKND